MELSEHHPWNWYGKPDSRVLIVGTFPPTKRNWSFDFFYPNKRNFFWRVLSAISGKILHHISGPEAVSERKALLDDLNICITDMGRQVIRKNNNSLDENLQAVVYMDILYILNQYPSINKVIFTSSSGKVSAVRWFRDYLQQKGIIHQFQAAPKPVRSHLQIGDRTVELVILYSPSARAANRISFEDLVALYKAEICS